jgi:hypothetical protein
LRNSELIGDLARRQALLRLEVSQDLEVFVSVDRDLVEHGDLVERGPSHVVWQIDLLFRWHGGGPLVGVFGSSGTCPEAWSVREPQSNVLLET